MADPLANNDFASQNITLWSPLTIYPVNSIVYLNNAIYIARIENYNQVPYNSLQNIDNTENGPLGPSNCIWSNNYFFWIPAYSSKLNFQDLNRRAQSQYNLTNILPEKFQKNQIAYECIFDCRSNAESAAIIEFVRAKQGTQPFLFSPQNPYNTLNKYRTIQTAKQDYVFYENNSLQITFRLVY